MLQPEPEPEPEMHPRHAGRAPNLAPVSAILTRFLPRATTPRPMDPQRRAEDVSRVQRGLVQLRWGNSCADDRHVDALRGALAATIAQDGAAALRVIDLAGNPDVTDASITPLIALLPSTSVRGLLLERTGVSAAVRLIARWAAAGPTGSADGTALTERAAARPARVVGHRRPASSRRPSHASQRRQDIARLLRNDPKLRVLEWGSWVADLGVSDADVKKLCRALPRNKNLLEIRLQRNGGVSDAALSALAAVLPRCAVTAVAAQGTAGEIACERWQTAKAAVVALEEATGESSDIAQSEEEEQGEEESCEDSGGTALVAAAKAGSEAQVKSLVARAAQTQYIHAVDDLGRSALWHACANGHDQVVALLLGSWHPPLSATWALERADVDGRTPLIAAARGGHVKVLLQLLAAGADSAKQDSRLRTALWYARSAFRRLQNELCQAVAARRGRTDAEPTWGAVALQSACVANTCLAVARNDPALKCVEWGNANSDRNFTDEHVLNLVEALSKGCAKAQGEAAHLREVDLRGNRVTDRSIKLLAEALAFTGCGVVRVALSAGEEEVMSEESKLFASKGLSYQRPSNEDDEKKPLLTVGVVAACKDACLTNALRLLAAPGGGGIETLNWGQDGDESCHYGDDAIDDLVVALRFNTTLRTLNLRHNAAITEANSRSRSVTQLLQEKKIRCTWPDRFSGKVLCDEPMRLQLAGRGRAVVLRSACGTEVATPRPTARPPLEPRRPQPPPASPPSAAGGRWQFTKVP